MLRHDSTRALCWLSFLALFVSGAESALSLKGKVDALSGAATLELNNKNHQMLQKPAESFMVGAPTAKPTNGLHCAAKTALRAAAIGVPCELLAWQLLKHRKAQQQSAAEQDERVSVSEALGLSGKDESRSSLSVKLAGFIGFGLFLAFVFGAAARRRGSVRTPRCANKVRIVAVPENQELQELDSSDESEDDRKEDLTEFFRIHTDKNMPEPNAMGNFSLPLGSMRAKTEELEAMPQVEFFRMDSGAPQQESYPSGTASGIVASIRAEIERKLSETWKRSPRFTPRIRREPSMPKQLYRDTSELVDEIAEQTNSGMMSWQTGGMKRQSSVKSQDSNGSIRPTSRKDSPGSPASSPEAKVYGA
mmetsp:Transcript_28628/g.65978  ORF Transcript_28628/g.65978 Transcript_28628/m.65978 type:complete len:363 (+) Transcript_28628:91-1179(+)